MLYRPLLLACLLLPLMAADPPAPITVLATVIGDSLRLDLDARITAKAGVAVDLLIATAALESVDAERGHRVAYDEARQAYTITFASDGDYRVQARFALRGRTDAVSGIDDGWHSAVVQLPAGSLRALRVVGDRPDLDLVLPGALRVQRSSEGLPAIAGILGPDRPLVVGWKQRPSDLVGGLVVSCDSDVVVRVVPGALRVDALFAYDIAQGTLDRLELSLTPGLEITAVEGSDVLDWRIAAADQRGSLVVRLAKPQGRACHLRVQGEFALGALPQAVAVPTILPLGTLRAGGTLAIGTDSALQLVVDTTAGLTQVDAAGAPRLAVAAVGDRPLPARSFLYVVPAAAWTARVALADIAPVVDVEHRVVATVREDELVIEDQLELEIREAPLRFLEVVLPAGFIVAAMEGAAVAVDACTVRQEDGQRVAVIAFAKPVLGCTVVRLRLELGHGPLAADVPLAAPRVRGARSERGVLALVAAAGLEVEGRAASGLRATPPAALPIRIPDARAAWRLTEPGWRLLVHAVRRPAAVRAESFQLAVLGEGAVHGSLTVAYVITGAPIDELRFTVPESLRDVEVVGADVAQTTRSGSAWTVRLRRKVVGDYNLALAWTQPLAVGAPAVLGEVRADGVDAQTGFLVCASERNVAVAPGQLPDGLRELAREEIPAGYRLLVTAPILRAWRHLGTPPRLELAIETWPAAKLLPAVVEVAHLETTLALREDGAAESLTRVRYHVKNATGQSLALRLPSGARIWSVERITADDGRERLSATSDGTALRIPLERLANPNQPATVELTYGETHTRGARVALTAPACIDVRTTYAGWTVTAPVGWAVRADGGTGMVAEPGPPAVSGLALVAQRVGLAWLVAVRVAFAAWPIAVGLAVVVSAVLLIRPRAAKPIAVIALAAVLSLAGVRAGIALHDHPWGGDAEAARHVAYAEILDAQGAAPAIAVAVLPAWRRDLALGALITHAALALAAAAAAWRWRRARLALGAVALAGLAAALAALPSAALLIAHLLAWGAPVALLVGVLIRARLALRPAAALALAGLAVAFLLGGCGSTVRPAGHAAGRADAVELGLSAEADALAVTMTIRVNTAGPLCLPLLSGSAVFTTPVPRGSPWRVERRASGHVLLIDRAGDHRLALAFVLPLAVADDDGMRAVTIDPPPALAVRAQLSVPLTAVDIAAVDGIDLAVAEAAGSTVASARFAPGSAIGFRWQARGRRTAEEVAQVFADVVGALRFDVGLVDGRHRVQLRIPQGELRALTLRLPPGMVATGFSGPQLATWRFDPLSATVEARFTAPISGSWTGLLSTRTAAADAATVTVGLPVVAGAESQRGVVGLYATGSVALERPSGGTALADADFQREAAALGADPLLAGATLRHARRLEAEAPLEVGLAAVTPELRVRERATFSVADERLVYASEVAIDVAKAGVFTIELLLPTGWDVDALSAPEVAHWDELTGEPRRALLHLAARTQGAIALKLGLSRTSDGLPPRLAVPRVAVVGALRHAGEVIVAPELGVRLTAARREGVSELDPAELGMTAAGVLAFRLLSPTWAVELAVERVAPVVTVTGVHQARVGEGLVRHAHRLHVRAQQAGLRVIEIALPSDATGIVAEGPDLAQWSEALRDGSRVVRIELRRKWVEKPYPLALGYETRFAADPGALGIAGARVLGAERQRDHLVVQVLERVELVDARPDGELTEADARAIPRESGLGELADAAFCYAAAGGTYRLGLTAKRHQAATQLEARVESTTIDTVVAANGGRIDRVRVQLTVGAKRHLAATLPAGAQVWALTVDRRPVAPATDSAGRLLLPLPQAGGGETSALVELVYAVAAPARTPPREFSGPRFDLPLTGVRWTLWLPEGWAVADTGGTLTADEQSTAIERYDLASYARAMAEADAADRAQVRDLQAKGVDFARTGNQYEARRALSSALNYATVDAALNEDARVQFNRLGCQQAVVGLVGRRNHLRRDAGAAPSGSADLGDTYQAEDAERLSATLGKDDSANVERIAARLMELQTQAAGAPTQLAITLPVRGRRLVFTRPLQVDPAAEMTVRITAHERPARPATWPWTVGLAAMLLGLGLVGQRAWRRAPVAPPPALDPWAGVETPPAE